VDTLMCQTIIKNVIEINVMRVIAEPVEIKDCVKRALINVHTVLSTNNIGDIHNINIHLLEDVGDNIHTSRLSQLRTCKRDSSFSRI